MTADEALAVLVQHADDYISRKDDHANAHEALAVLQSGLQHARVLARVVEDPSRSVYHNALCRFREWERGERA